MQSDSLNFACWCADQSQNVRFYKPGTKGALTRLLVFEWEHLTALSLRTGIWNQAGMLCCYLRMINRNWTTSISMSCRGNNDKTYKPGTFEIHYDYLDRSNLIDFSAFLRVLWEKKWKKSSCSVFTFYFVGLWCFVCLVSMQGHGFLNFCGSRSVS